MSEIFVIIPSIGSVLSWEGVAFSFLLLRNGRVNNVNLQLETARGWVIRVLSHYLPDLQSHISKSAKIEMEIKRNSDLANKNTGYNDK